MTEWESSRVHHYASNPHNPMKKRRRGDTIGIELEVEVVVVVEGMLVTRD